MSFMAVDSRISVYITKSDEPNCVLWDETINAFLLQMEKYFSSKDNLIVEKKIMLYLCAVLYFAVIIFPIQNVMTKNHFKGEVFKDPYKIKRLVQFQNNLCKEMDGLLRNYECQLLRYISYK